MFSLDYLHHQVIHFPIALLSISIFFDFLAIYFKNHKLFFSGWCTLLTGALLSVVAIITGFIADIVYGHMSEPFPIFQTHGSTQILSLIHIPSPRDATLSRMPSSAGKKKHIQRMKRLCTSSDDYQVCLLPPSPRTRDKSGICLPSSSFTIHIHL
mgnify:CR=1 FL=1